MADPDYSLNSTSRQGESTTHDGLLSPLHGPLAPSSHLVEKDTTKVFPVREHVRLAGQVGTTRVNEVQAGQLAGLGDLLQAQVLLQEDAQNQ